MQRLIDEHVIALGIDPKIPPFEITDPEFAAHVAAGESSWEWEFPEPGPE